jgi:hypothetical protein
MVERMFLEALTSATIIITPMPVITTGWASQYGRSVMERTVELRQRWGQLPEDLSGYDGFVAAQECADIGKVVYLRPVEWKRWERFLVADCASKNDRQSDTDPRSGWQWMVSQNILVEVDFQTAARWQTIGRGIRIEMGWEVESDNITRSSGNRGEYLEGRVSDG